ncbi:putative leucine-rich repeat-containing, plant-type, leucine-rich repeat domain superfamily [Helianthus annuus]|nr:putative leucine-rich repeat-containing, plant-type, leucine-rich repeat domain superfamily [Helianthus annuus]
MATTVSTPLIIFSILFILTCIPTSSFSCPSHQKQALLHFKSSLTSMINSTSYQFLQLKSWNPSSNCCSWERVNCDGTKKVIELHLDGLVVLLPDIDPAPILSNILAPLFHIRSLKLLDISNNSLHGEIPGDGFLNLTELIHLEMHDNFFNGSIPSQLFGLRNLRYLDMGYNMLDGKLEPEIGSLRNLTTL